MKTYSIATTTKTSATNSLEETRKRTEEFIKKYKKEFICLSKR